jgi:hypothetical protein
LRYQHYKTYISFVLSTLLRRQKKINVAIYYEIYDWDAADKKKKVKIKNEKYKDVAILWWNIGSSAPHESRPLPPLLPTAYIINNDNRYIFNNIIHI